MPIIAPSSIKKDYEALLNDRSFENLLAAKRFLLHVNIADAELIIEETKTIIQILNDEVAK